MLSNLHPVVFVFATLIQTSWGFPVGAPSFSCKNLIPAHSNGTQPGPAPYRISVSSTQLAPGGSTSISLSSTGDFPFLGFLCSVSAREDMANNTLGTMTLRPFAANEEANLQTVDCSGSGPSTGVTHVSREPKFQVDYEWTAPAEASVGEEYKLRCTVVQSFFRCWTNLMVVMTIGTDGSSAMAGTSDNSNSNNSNNNNNNNNNSNNNNSNNNTDGNTGAQMGVSSAHPTGTGSGPMAGATQIPPFVNIPTVQNGMPPVGTPNVLGGTNQFPGLPPNQNSFPGSTQGGGLGAIGQNLDQMSFPNTDTSLPSGPNNPLGSVNPDGFDPSLAFTRGQLGSSGPNVQPTGFSLGNQGLFSGNDNQTPISPVNQSFQPASGPLPVGGINNRAGNFNRNNNRGMNPRNNANRNRGNNGGPRNFRNRNSVDSEPRSNNFDSLSSRNLVRDNDFFLDLPSRRSQLINLILRSSRIRFPSSNSGFFSPRSNPLSRNSNMLSLLD
ncbi:hybrid signal transduction histidine kinase A [Aplysia californica]|uniref:Hybrid signal transduction histidine kinase A n=1 Tax=Aplysia californica TaxID=6500 RepID=A0ABM1AC26_APLCA|nr:hybrid signal transduction histidine kinase A [Aplysia californica]